MYGSYNERDDECEGSRTWTEISPSRQRRMTEAEIQKYAKEMPDAWSAEQFVLMARNGDVLKGEDYEQITYVAGPGQTYGTEVSRVRLPGYKPRG